MGLTLFYIYTIRAIGEVGVRCVCDGSGLGGSDWNGCLDRG